jgi:hypothetical protein
MVSESDLRRELHDTLAEYERLRKENTKLKALLKGFSLTPASALLGKREPTARQTAVKEKPEPSSSRDELGSRISLFRGLFRGREDVYAVRWESRNG